MYCPSCGLQQTQELRYCTRCGANLNPPAKESERANLVGPIWAVSLAITLITLTGLGLVFAFAMALISSGVSLTSGVFLLIAFFLLVVLIIAGLLARQLSRLLNLHAQPGAQSDRGAQSNKNDLKGKTVLQIESPREPPVSVTENTTRTFAPVPIERQTK